ncbi:MAG: FAD-dependent oxidoreductase [Candidatus Deferrimicrobiaceae bacterium]
MNRKNEARSLETIESPKRVPGKRKTAEPAPKPADYDVLVVGGGPAGLAAAAFCGRKQLRTGVFEGDSWGGILTRWCPDKRIDNYPGVRPGILARELAHFLIEDTRRADVDLIEGRVEEITPGREVLAGSVKERGKILILANGSTAAEAGILREREFAGRRGGVHYLVRNPAAFRGKRVVVVGGGETAISFVQRLSGIASRITLVHRQSAFRFSGALPKEFDRERGIHLLRDSTVEEILGSRYVEGVRIREHATGKTANLPADAVIMAVGRRPNNAIFRDLDLTLDPGGRVQTDLWQRTNVPGVLAVGDVSSHLKMIVTAVAQAATAAHQAYLDIRTPYWK